MKILKKPKTSLILLIIALVILALTGSYFFYAQSLLKKTTETDDTVQVRQNSQDNGLIDNQEINNKSNQVASIPEDWKEYELAGCGASIQIPGDWITEQSDISREKNISAIYNITSPEFLADLKRSQQKSTVAFEGMMNDLTINCYKSLEDLTKQWWDPNRKDEPNLKDPQNLKDALTRTGLIGKNHESIDPMPIMGTSDVQEVEIADKKAFVGYQIGTPGAVLTYYFENPKNGKIISFESEMTEYQEKRLKEPHSKIIENFQWLE